MKELFKLLRYGDHLKELKYPAPYPLRRVQVKSTTRLNAFILRLYFSSDLTKRGLKHPAKSTLSKEKKLEKSKEKTAKSKNKTIDNFMAFFA